MNRYNSLISRLFQPLPWSGGWAITLDQTTYYSCDEAEVSRGWQAHEDCHKKQWARDGRLKFLARYIWQLFRVGYVNIDYEIEARAASLEVRGV